MKKGLCWAGGVLWSFLQRRWRIPRHRLDIKIK